MAISTVGEEASRTDRRLRGAWIAGVFGAAVSQTGPVAALPAVTADLGELDRISWVLAAYLIGCLIVVPVMPKLTARHGAKATARCGLLLFIVGAVLSGAAQTVGALGAFRLLQGLGGGAVIAAGDPAHPWLRRSSRSGRLGLALLAGVVVGPLLGGLLTDLLGWQWTFWAPVPFAASALVAVSIARGGPKAIRNSLQIDYVGPVLLGCAVASLVLLLTIGGTACAWVSAATGAFGIVVIGVRALLVVVERRAAEPILPPELFYDWSFLLPWIVSFMATAMAFGCLAYLPFLLWARGSGPAAAGAQLLLLTVGVVAGAVASRRFAAGGVLARWRGAGGLAAAAAAMATLSALSKRSNLLALDGLLLVLGLGVGIAAESPLRSVAVAFRGRRGKEARDILLFFRFAAGAVGAAAFAAVFGNRLVSLAGCDSISGPGLAKTHCYSAQSVITSLDTAFAIAAGVTAIAALLSLGLRDEEPPPS